MKLAIKIAAGTQVREHAVELSYPAEAARLTQGKIEFVFDGESRAADWAEVSRGCYSILSDGQSFDVQVSRPATQSLISGDWYTVIVAGRHYLVELRDPRREKHSETSVGPEGPQDILAPMPGRIIKVLVSEKQEVRPGAGLLVIEAMKMQNEIRAPRGGRVEKIFTREGQGVEAGAQLLRLV